MDAPFVSMAQNYLSGFEDIITTDKSYITHPIIKQQQLCRLNLKMNFYRTYKHHPNGLNDVSMFSQCSCP